jgi:hypothetical protein
MVDQGPVQSSSALRFPEWQSEYEAVCQEKDTSKLFTRVEVAEAALHNRLEILSGSSNHGAERSAIASALVFLQEIKRDRLPFDSGSDKTS